MTRADLCRWARNRIHERWMPGAVWTVDGREGSIVGAAGKLTFDAAGGRAVTPETIYDLASLTKPLCTSLLVGLLEQDGLLDLRARLDEIICESRGTPYGRVTVAQLARHQAGLPAWSPLFLDERGGDLIARILRLPPALAIGDTLYSDPGYMLLGRLVERVGGESLAVAFDRRIARPLSLQRAGFSRPGERYADAAPTEEGNFYERAMAVGMSDDRRWRTSIPAGEVHDANAHALGGTAGHAGLFGSAREVVAIARELLDSQQLGLSSATRRRMLFDFESGRSLAFEAASFNSAGRGLLPDKAPGHTGFTGTSLWIDPALGAVYVLLTNRVHPRVGSRNFQRLRRGFHRTARRMTARDNWAGDGSQA